MKILSFKTHIVADQEVEVTFNWAKSFMSITVITSAKLSSCIMTNAICAQFSPFSSKSLS